jgi:hypothetical protein
VQLMARSHRIAGSLGYRYLHKAWLGLGPQRVFIAPKAGRLHLHADECILHPLLNGAGGSPVTRTAALSVRVSPEVKAVLEELAANDHRTVASLVEKVLLEWLRTQGAFKHQPGEVLKHAPTKLLRGSRRRV